MRKSIRFVGLGLLGILLSGCNGTLGKIVPPPDAPNLSAEQIQSSRSVTKDGRRYLIECSGADPALCWGIGPDRLDGLMHDAVDVMSYDTIKVLQGDRYRLVRQCEGIATGGDKYSGPLQWPVIFRVLELRNQKTPWLFRPEDMSGRKLRNYIVVASYLRPAGNYSHWIDESNNNLEKITHCKE